MKSTQSIIDLHMQQIRATEPHSDTFTALWYFLLSLRNMLSSPCLLTGEQSKELETMLNLERKQPESDHLVIARLRHAHARETATWINTMHIANTQQSEINGEQTHDEWGQWTGSS